MLPYPASPLILRFVVGTLLFSLIYGAIIKYFERRLAFWQAYLIAVVANSVLAVLLAVYNFSKAEFDVSPVLDLGANLAGLALWGFIITRMAANYGIRKKGRFGLGSKAVFATTLLMLIFVIAVIGINVFLGQGVPEIKG
ncbi:hypothetical protein [Bradyrhizobium sp. McL0616]|uniref:hypothetical protein n=1 Tax=Bradyrhizobium sp. McL0616 TaxID=3415674 RepID=UPI003CEBD646